MKWLDFEHKGKNFDVWINNDWRYLKDEIYTFDLINFQIELQDGVFSFIFAIVGIRLGLMIWRNKKWN